MLIKKLEELTLQLLKKINNWSQEKSYNVTCTGSLMYILLNSTNTTTR